MIVPTGGPRQRGWTSREAIAWMMVLFVFTIPFEEFYSVPGLGSLTRLIGLVTVPFALVAIFEQGRLRLRSPMVFVVATALFVVWNLTTYFWSRAPAATFSAFVTNAQLLVFVWLLSEFCRERRWLLRLMQAYVLGAIVAFGFAAIDAFFVVPGRFRATAGFDPNEFATILALGIPMAAWLVVRGAGHRLHIVNAMYPLIAAFGIVLGASRGGLLVGVIALAAVPLAFLRVGMLRRILMFTLLAATMVFVFSIAPNVFPDLYRNIERLAETGEQLAEGTLTGRRIIWGATATMIEQSPIIGLGTRAPRFALAETSFGKPRAVHNVFLSITADSGLIGLLVFMCVLAVVVVSALQTERANRLFALILIVAMVVAMMPLSIETRKYTWFVLTLVASLRPLTFGYAKVAMTASHRVGRVVALGRGNSRATSDRV